MPTLGFLTRCKTSKGGGAPPPSLPAAIVRQRRCNLRQARAETVLGFLDLPQQLRDGSAASQICVVALKLVENTLAPAIQSAGSFRHV